MPTRNVTPTPEAPDASRSEADYPTSGKAVQEADRPRYRLYKLCLCEACEGTGKTLRFEPHGKTGIVGKEVRCPECRGEGRSLSCVAEAHDLRGIGAAFATLAEEGELLDCPIGLLDSRGETGRKWLVRPWEASPRNVSDAGRVLAKSKGEKNG